MARVFPLLRFRRTRRFDRAMVLALAVAGGTGGSAVPAAFGQTTTTTAPDVVATPLGTLTPPVDTLSVKATVSQILQYESNPLLQREGAVGVMGAITTPNLKINSDTDASHLDLESYINNNEYDREHFSSTDLHSRLHANSRGATWQFSLTGGVDYDTTLTSEQLTTGLNIAGIRHTGLSLSPTLGYAVSPVDVVAITPSYMSSFYEDKTVFTNIQVLGITPSWSHAFDAANTGTVTVQESQFKTLSGAATSIDTQSLMVGWNHQFTPAIAGTSSVGVQRSTWEFAPSSGQTNTSSTDYAFAFGLTYTGEQDTLSFNATRTPNPLGSGLQAQTTAFTLSERHQVTPRLELDFTGSYQMSDYPDSVTSGSQSVQKSHATVSPSIIYHATDEVDLSLAYRYRQQQSEKLSGNGQGATTQPEVSTQSIIFSFTYLPKALAFP